MLNTDMQSFNEETIDIGEILFALYKKMSLIIAFTILCGLIGFSVSKFIISPKYEASAMLLVNSGDRGIDYVTGEQISSSATLVNVYGIIIKSEAVLNKVYENLVNDQVELKEIYEINIEPVHDTPVMRISVIADDEEYAYRFCQEITKVAPDVIVESVGGGSVTLLSEANLLERPVSPNIKKNTAECTGIGFLLICGLICLVTLLDNKIQKEDDLSKMGLPLVGVIPTYDMEE